MPITNAKGIKAKSERQYNYNPPKHFKGWTGKRVDYEKGQYPSKDTSGEIKEAGPKLGEMIKELVEFQNEILSLTEEIQRIEAEKEEEKKPHSTRRAELQQTLVPEKGREVFSLLSDSIENLEEGAAHFRRYENILLGIREAMTEEKKVKVNKEKALWEFIEKNHPEIMALAKIYIDELSQQVEKVETGRVVTTQTMDEARFPRVRRAISRGFGILVSSIKAIFSSSVNLEKIMHEYVETIELMAE